MPLNVFNTVVLILGLKVGIPLKSSAPNHFSLFKKSLNRSKLRVISIVESLSQSAPSDEFTRVGNFSFVDTMTCIVSDGLITLCIMPNCLADNISLYCGDPYERFACILVYEDLFLLGVCDSCGVRHSLPGSARSERWKACVLMGKWLGRTAVLLTTRFFEAHCIRHR